MKKVPAELIPALLEQEEVIREASAYMKNMFATPLKESVLSDYKKEPEVPDGEYFVKLVDVRCHGPYTYQMEVEIIEGEFAGKIIKGYSRRYGDDHSVLRDCFSYKKECKRSTGYIGGKGVVQFNNSYWFYLIPRLLCQGYFPDAFAPVEELEDGFFTYCPPDDDMVATSLIC